MAKRPKNNPAEAPAGGGKLGELKIRLAFLVGALVVFRAGTFIPVPGVDPAALAAFFDQQAGNMLALFNMFSGGALSRFGIFALGIMPYISASIIMQMASMIVPSLQALRKEGESGKRKITQYTRYGTVVVGIEGDANSHVDDLLDDADVIFATAKAGIQVLNEKQVAATTKLKVAADLNAVPPAGIEGINRYDNGEKIKSSWSHFSLKLDFI